MTTDFLRPMGRGSLYACTSRFGVLVIGLAIGLTSQFSRADVIGIGDHTPAHEDTFGESVSDLPQFGGVLNETIIIGGTGQSIGGTASGQMVIDIPSETDPLTTDGGVIGGNRQGLGLVRLVELNSEWVVNNSLVVGEFGQGFLEIIAGARLTTIGGTVIDNYDFIMGLQEDSQGFALVDGFASLLLNVNASIGHRSFGAIEAINRARIETIQNATLGAEATGEGSVYLEGLGTRWNVGLTAGGLDGVLTIGGAGYGTLEIVDQARARAGSDTIIGDEQNSFGHAIVSGRNSLLWTFGDMIVGNDDFASGRLEINDNAVARTEQDTLVGVQGFIDLAGGTYVSTNTSAVITNNGVIRGDGRIDSIVENNSDIRNAASIANIRERLLFSREVFNDANGLIESIGGEMEFQSAVENDGLIYGKDAIFRFRGGLTGGGELEVDNAVIQPPAATPLTVAALTVGPSRSHVTGDIDVGSMNVSLGDDFSQLWVTGSAFLSGAFSLSLDDGFTAQPGDSFEVLRSGLRVGQFAAPDPSLPWTLEYTPTSVFVTFESGPQPVIGADFNSDGVVDGADLAIWQANNGLGLNPPPSATNADGDANGDGRVDGADFLLIQRQWGPVPVLPAGAENLAAVPEPTGLALGLVALMLPLLGRSRNR